MFDQPWPVLAGSVLVVLFFVSLLTYVLVVGVRNEKRERAAIAQRKQHDTQQMIRKMRERHQGSSLEGFDPAEQLVLTKPAVVPATPAQVKSAIAGPIEFRLKQLTTVIESEIKASVRSPPAHATLVKLQGNRYNVAEDRQLSDLQRTLWHLEKRRLANSPPRGTVLCRYCDGSTQLQEIADGQGGSHKEVYQYRSVDCGYVG